MHTTFIRRLCAFTLFLLAHGISFGQTAFWQKSDLAAPSVLMGPATRYLTLRSDLSSLRAHLTSDDAAARSSERTIALPLPDGSFAAVTIEPTEVLTPEIQATHPDIQTFKGSSANGEYSVRLTVSPYGVIARMSTPKGVVYIQPLDNAQPAWSAVYFARDAAKPEGGISCGVTTDADQEETSSKTAAFSHGDANLRTYVMSVAATGEYTTWAGGGTPNQAAALAQITAAINNINAIFERDLAIHFSLNSPNSILFTNAATDPYTNVTGSADATDLNENQTTLDNVILSANYDIGHLFHNGFNGGLAQTPSVCGSGKARAASGITGGPSGAGFESVVAHEIGHQFSAGHTHAANNNSPGCAGTVSATSSWEPGGGSTIMAYAGSCNPNAYQAGNDLYFHGGSLKQMGDYMKGTTGNSCATLSNPGNSLPVVTISPLTYTIPYSTPFRLTAPATDANNAGTLTYTWEQIDAFGSAAGTSTAPASTDATGPLFRSFPPSASNTRYLPNLTALLAGTATPYEVLPSIASRVMNFRATVRDNNAGAGGTGAEDVVVTTANCGPFEITSQSTATSLTANGTNQMTVTWNTADACVTCPNVTLKYTSDGTTFSTLLSSTPNDGTETFFVPNLPTCGGTGRLMLECSNNIFFDVNAGGITINSSCAANGATFLPATALVAPLPGDAALNQSLAPQYGTQYGTISGQITSGDPAGGLTIVNTATNSCAYFGGNPTNYDTYTIYPATAGTYTFTAAGGNPFGLVYNLYEGAYNSATPCSGFLSSSGTTLGVLNNSVSATLCANRQYTLVVSSFDVGLPTLPASYSITVSGGNVFSGQPNPGAGFNYRYVIVNNMTGNIVSIQSTGDMTNTTTFPAGQYTVYGLSTNASAGTLNGFVGSSFSAFNAAVLNQTSGLCASFSSNNRSVTIDPTALPLADVRLEAALTGRRSAHTSWTVTGSEAGTRQYVLQRSYDGQTFETVAVTNTTGVGRYEATDANLRDAASGVHYRVAAHDFSGKLRYSGSVYLTLEGPASPALAIAPNPVQDGVLRVKVGAAAAGRGTAMVLDATGRVVLSASLNLIAGTQAVELPVGSLSAGVYLLRVDGAGAALQARFVKSR